MRRSGSLICVYCQFKQFFNLIVTTRHDGQKKVRTVMTRPRAMGRRQETITLEM